MDTFTDYLPIVICGVFSVIFLVILFASVIVFQMNKENNSNPFSFFCFLAVAIAFVTTFSIFYSAIGSSLHERGVEKEKSTGIPAYSIASSYNSVAMLPNGMKVCQNGKLLKVYIHKSVPREFWPAILTAINKWNLALNVNVLQFGGYASGGTTMAEFNQNNAVLVTYGELSQISGNETASSFFDGGKLVVRSIITMCSNCNFFTGLPSMVDQNSSDFDSVIIHELGHSLGLPDNYNDTELIMYAYNTPGEINQRTIQVGDIRLFSCTLGVMNEDESPLEN